MQSGDIEGLEHSSIDIDAKRTILYGWDSVNLAYTRIVCDANGKLKIDTSASDLRYLKLDQSGTPQTVFGGIPSFTSGIYLSAGAHKSLLMSQELWLTGQDDEYDFDTDLNCNGQTPFTDSFFYLHKISTDTYPFKVDFLGNITGLSLTIGVNKLDTTEWAFLDGQDQAVKSGSNVSFGTIASGVDTISGNNGNATFTLLNLNNNHTPLTGQTAQTSCLVFNLTQSINSVVSLHEAASICAYKVSDWFHASAETDTDSGLKFYTTSNGTPTLQLTISDLGSLLLPTGKWVGLGSSSGRLYFLDAATDLVEVTGAYFIADSRIGINTTAPAAPLHIYTTPTETSEASRIEGYVNTGFGDTTDLYKTYKNITATVNATQSTHQTYSLSTGELIIIRAFVTGVQEGGTSSTAWVSYILTATVNNVSGTAAIIGSVTIEANENAAGASCDATIDVSGVNARVRVTGLAAVNMVWSSTVKVQSTSTNWQPAP